MDQEKDSKQKKTVKCLRGGEQFSNPEYLSLIMEKARKLNLDVNPHCDSVFRTLLLYFWQDERFESEGHGSLNKGIYLVGNTGTGKTTLMNLFTYNVIEYLKVVSTNTVCDDYQINGIGYLNSEYTGYSSHICFDDLGCETTAVQNMGNSINVMERIILWRYESKGPKLTHFTSNLSAPQIEELYGTRVRSRLREMVNFIELTGEDRRK